MFQSLLLTIMMSLVGGVQAPNGLNWTVGDTADYNLSMGFLKGTMKMSVHQEIDKGFWVHQDISLMGQQQKAEILFDKNTGELLELRVNGEKQELPDPGNQEIVETKGTTVTVPAGTFDCLYAKIRDIDKNEESEAWINPDLIPIMGMLKQLAPGQFGQVVIELTAFNKQ